MSGTALLNGGQEYSPSRTLAQGPTHLAFAATVQHSLNWSTPHIDLQVVKRVLGFHARQLPVLLDKLGLAVAVCILYP